MRTRSVGKSGVYGNVAEDQSARDEATGHGIGQLNGLDRTDGVMFGFGQSCPELGAVQRDVPSQSVVVDAPGHVGEARGSHHRRLIEHLVQSVVHRRFG